MIEVSRLESHWKQYNDDGTVLHGIVDPKDTGVMQINTDHWGAMAERRGLDINRITDNVKMARYIYDTQGITAWVAYNVFLARK